MRAQLSEDGLCRHFRWKSVVLFLDLLLHAMWNHRGIFSLRIFFILWYFSIASAGDGAEVQHGLIHAVLATPICWRYFWCVFSTLFTERTCLFNLFPYSVEEDIRDVQYGDSTSDKYCSYMMYWTRIWSMDKKMTLSKSVACLRPYIPAISQEMHDDKSWQNWAQDK